MIEAEPRLSPETQEVWSAAYDLGVAGSTQHTSSTGPPCASIESSSVFGARHVAYILFCQHPLGARVAWGTGCTDVAVLRNDISRCANLSKEAAKASGMFDNAQELLLSAQRRKVASTTEIWPDAAALPTAAAAAAAASATSTEEATTTSTATTTSETADAIELGDLLLALFEPNFRLLPIFHKAGLRLEDASKALPRAIRAVDAIYRSTSVCAGETPASSSSSSPAYPNSSSGANHEPPATLNQAMKTAAARLRDLNGGSGGSTEEGPAPKAPSAIPTPDEIDAEMRELAPRAARRASQRRPVLASCSTDLVQRAREGSLDPVIGRDQEVSRVLQILSRRTKNNVALVGPPGVGKTAVAEAIAQRIAEGRVPPQLKGCEELWALDIGALLAGTGLRGDFEERLRDLLAEIRASQGAALLFIDELHLILGAGRSENNNVDAANLMKPMLARGELRCIGATTTEEYEHLIYRKDAAFERRFQVVQLKEPDSIASVAMLQGLIPLYERHHNIKIPLHLAEAAVHASIQFIPKRNLPDKAIDIMDEACCYATEMGASEVTQDHIQVVAERWNGPEESREPQLGSMTSIDKEGSSDAKKKKSNNNNSNNSNKEGQQQDNKDSEHKEAGGWLDRLSFPWMSRRSRL